MNVMEEIVERMKDVISHDHPNRKIRDKHVALALSIRPDSLCVKKAKGLIPYEEVVMFCLRRKISVNWMLFGIGQMEMSNAVKGL